MIQAFVKYTLNLDLYEVHSCKIIQIRTKTKCINCSIANGKLCIEIVRVVKSVRVSTLWYLYLFMMCLVTVGCWRRWPRCYSIVITAYFSLPPVPAVYVLCRDIWKDTLFTISYIFQLHVTSVLKVKVDVTLLSNNDVHMYYLYNKVF